MSRLHLPRLHFKTLRNFLQIKYSLLPISRLQPIPAVSSRCYAQYQFRTIKPIYYPDRSIEMKRNDAMTKASEKGSNSDQALANTRPVEKKSLPKDYYYKVLGVGKLATTQQIKQAFYALAKRFHPDSTHSEQKLKHFQELSNAYNILTDETKRLEYDQLGAVVNEQAFLAQASDPINLGKTTQTTNLKAPVMQKIGIKQKTETPKKEELFKLTTTEPDLELNFSEATLGVKKRLDLRYLLKCPNCNGKSVLLANRDMGNEICHTCLGTGEIIKKTATYTTVNVCPQCKGKRFLNRNNCEKCENQGFVLNKIQVLVNVPAGSKTGDVVSIDNPKTKQRINYHLHVKESDYFTRDGNNVHTFKYLNISDAILGGVFKIRGLYEDIEIKVPPGTQSHTEILVKNKGIRTQEGIGNHIIKLIVNIPTKLSVKQRQLVLALAKTEEPIFERPYKQLQFAG